MLQTKRDQKRAYNEKFHFHCAIHWPLNNDTKENSFIAFSSSLIYQFVRSFDTFCWMNWMQRLNEWTGQIKHEIGRLIIIIRYSRCCHWLQIHFCFTSIAKCGCRRNEQSINNSIIDIKKKICIFETTNSNCFVHHIRTLCTLYAHVW